MKWKTFDDEDKSTFVIYTKSHAQLQTFSLKDIKYGFDMVKLSILCNVRTIREDAVHLEIITGTIPESYFPSPPSCIEMQLC